MIRLTYLIPRLIILGLIGLVVWLSADALLRKALIYHAEAVTGAKVEVARLRSSLEQGKVFLSELQIADPRQPNQNLLQADMAYLDLDLARLLRRQIYISGGRSSGLRFGSPRTESGSLGLTASPTETTPTKQVTEPATHPGKAATTLNFDEIEAQWLADVRANIAPSSGTNNMASMEAQRLAEFWPARFQKPRQQLNDVTSQISTITKKIESENNNPLRRNFAAVMQELSGLQLKTAQLQDELNQLQKQSETDLQQLNAAQQRDQLANQTEAVSSFDGTAMSQLLLANSQRARVDDIIGWFRWFRDAVPNLENDFPGTGQRGVNIVLDESMAAPGFLIEQLDLEGAGHFSGQYLNFAGTVRNLSNAPQQHELPVEFELRAQGLQHFVINCSIDRRSNESIDTLAVRCPDLQITPEPLGGDRSVLVTVGPDLKMQADVNLQANGDQVTGRLVFRHSNVSLHVDQLSPLAGGTDLALRMNHELTALDQFETVVLVSGTLDDYAMQMESDLGDQFAESMNRITNETLQRQVASDLQQQSEASMAKIQHVKQSIAGQLQELTSQLEVADQHLKETQDRISATAKSAWPNIR